MLETAFEKYYWSGGIAFVIAIAAAICFRKRSLRICAILVALVGPLAAAAFLVMHRTATLVEYSEFIMRRGP